MRRVAHVVVVLTLLVFVVTLVGCGGSNGPSRSADSVAKKPPPGGDARYDIVDLGALPSGDRWSPHAVNDAGQVAGQGDSAHHACVWQGGIMTELHPGGYYSSFAHQINEAGQIAGTMSPQVGTANGVVWERDPNSGEWSSTGLPTLGGPYCQCSGINDAVPYKHGVQVVGKAQDAAEEEAPVIWERDGAQGAWEIGELHVLSSYTGAGPGDISDSGTIVGTAWVGDEPHAITWDAATRAMHELAGVTSVKSSATAVNESGVILGGGGVTPSGVFIWENGSVTDVGVLKNFDYTLATDINSAGQVIGWCEQRKPARWGMVKTIRRAILWEQGELSDLNDLIPDDTGWVLTQVRGIGEDGKIVGQGALNDEWRAFMLVPRG